MKVLSIIPALLLGATSVSAGVDSDFGRTPVTINRSGAASIRSCSAELGGDYTELCYNQTTTVRVGDRLRERSTERVVRVRCDVPHTADTTRGAVAREFCPQVLAGTLAPAPFLL